MFWLNPILITRKQKGNGIIRTTYLVKECKKGNKYKYKNIWDKYKTKIEDLNQNIYCINYKWTIHSNAKDVRINIIQNLIT